MDKISVSLTTKKSIRLDPDSSIFVVPFINLTNKAIYIKNYVATYFKENDFVDDYLEAEWELMLSIIGDHTNYKIEDDLDINALIDSGFWDSVTEKIQNYYEFRSELDTIIDHLNKEREINK